MARNAALKEKIRLHLYKALIRPILTYAYPIWLNTSNRSLDAMFKFERRCLRSILKEHYLQRLYRSINPKLTNFDLYQKANTPTIGNFLLKNATKFASNLQHTENMLIKIPTTTRR